MQKKNPKTRCERRSIDKAEGVCRFYSKIQSVYRFKRELERANAANCKLYLIVEDATWADIFTGNYRSQIEPEVLLSYLSAYQAHYNMQINFISREHSGKLIKAILDLPFHS